MNEPYAMGCDGLADVAAELAFGVLTGRERADALAHLDQCEACRENVRQLTMTGEEMVTLLPASEPPLGFETRVMERLGLTTPELPPSPAAHGRSSWTWLRRKPGQVRGRPPGRTRWMLTAAAVMAAVTIAGLGGWGLRGATSPSPAMSRLSSAILLSNSRQPAGMIFVYTGHPGWLYMSVDMASGNETVICQVVSLDGHVTTVGAFRLANGYGSWGSPEPSDAGPPVGARLISTDGAVLATASFPPH